MLDGSVLAQAGSSDIDWVLLVAGLLGGLAIFLLGMDRMTDSLRLISGDRMRDVLGRLTKNRFVGASTGAGVTAVLQSSSVTTVLVVGFISSGLMSFQQSVSVIVGANIGTTVTAQLIAFEITTLALFAVAVGFGFSFFAKRPDRRAQGTAVMGLGLVFFGMSLMGDAMAPLRTSEAFLDVMTALENPLLGIAVGAVFTGLVQSSSATTGIVIVLAQQGLISLDAGIALVLGANVGTSITALLAAIGKPREALQAAWAHTLFNVGGVLLWLPLVGVLASMVEGIGGATARQVANAHTIFNVANAVVALALLPQFARFVQRVIADRPEDAHAALRARYLDRALLSTPPLALDQARLELLRMASRVQAMLAAALPAVLGGTRWEVVALEGMDDEVDDLHGQVIEYLGDISTQRLSESSTDELIGLMDATNDLEAIGDIIETNMTSLGLSRVERGLVVSDETKEVLVEFHEAVTRALEFSIVALAEKDLEAARWVDHMKDEINSLEQAATGHQAERLLADAPDRVANYRLEVDVIANLKRIYYFAKRIARVVVPRDERADL